jgi:hypothetical protein
MSSFPTVNSFKADVTKAKLKREGKKKGKRKSFREIACNCAKEGFSRGNMRGHHNIYYHVNLVTAFLDFGVRSTLHGRGLHVR